MKQGVIVLIPKPEKDKRLVDNLRPITILNNDYNILSHIYASRLKSTLPEIISTTQTGFMKNRSIHDNIRLVLDLLDYDEFITDNSFMLFLDFKKSI